MGLLAVLSLAGAAALPLRVTGPPPSSMTAASALAPEAGAGSPAAPLLFVGIDSGNWRTLRPLLERNELPTFRRLISEGIHGDVHALWPPYWSAPAWASIVTGYGRAEVGIYEDLVVSAPGLPLFQMPVALDPWLNPFLFLEHALSRMGVIRVTFPPRAAIRRTPFWELVSDAGVRTAVVRFRFTFPAEGRADVVISDWVGHDQWELLGVRKDARSGLVAPAAEAGELLASFGPGVRLEEDGVAGLFPELEEGLAADSIRDPLLYLRLALDIDRRTLQASERLLRRHPDLGVLAVYLGGFDTVSHAYWQFRFPEDFPEDPLLPVPRRELASTLDRYLVFLDRRLGDLIAAYDTPPNVVIVSDHGHEAIHSHALWKGWHAREGILIAEGPGVPKRVAPMQVSYYDVVPTVLQLTGFRKPAELRGTSLLGEAGGELAANP